jgi:L-amino acid N-acyltransferase YncA
MPMPAGTETVQPIADPLTRRSTLTKRTDERELGLRLYETLLRMLRRQGFRSAFAEIVLPHPGSVRLHEALEFEPIGVHRDVGVKLG